MKLLGILVIYSPSKDFKLYISWGVCSSPTPISKGARYSCWSLKTFLPASNLCLSLATACPLCGLAKARLVFSVPGWNRISIHPGHSCLDVFGVFLSWAQVTRKAQAIYPSNLQVCGSLRTTLEILVPFTCQNLFAFFRDAFAPASHSTFLSRFEWQELKSL